MKLLLKLFLLSIAVSMISGCASYDRSLQSSQLNDEEMQFSSHGSSFEDYVFSIRTGSLKAGSSKSGGGCGCN